jgi:hypothetical protein
MAFFFLRSIHPHHIIVRMQSSTGSPGAKSVRKELSRKVRTDFVESSEYSDSDVSQAVEVVYAQIYRNQQVSEETQTLVRQTNRRAQNRKTYATRLAASWKHKGVKDTDTYQRLQGVRPKLQNVELAFHKNCPFFPQVHSDYTDDENASGTDEDQDNPAEEPSQPNPRIPPEIPGKLRVRRVRHHPWASRELREIVAAAHSFRAGLDQEKPTIVVGDSISDLDIHTATKQIKALVKQDSEATMERTAKWMINKHYVATVAKILPSDWKWDAQGLATEEVVRQLDMEEPPERDQTLLASLNSAYASGSDSDASS